MKTIIDFTDESLYVDWYDELTNALYDPNIRYIFLKGGAGAGKSYLVAQLLIQNVVDGVRIAAFRKVRSSLRASCFQLMKDIVNAWDLHDVIEVREMLAFLSRNNEGFCHMFGLDDSEKIKSIAGIDWIRIEEATELTYDDFGQLDLRLRGGKNHKVIASFNPISEKHWLKTEIHDNPEWQDGTVWIEKTAWDNKFVDQQYLIRLEKLKTTNPAQYRVYAQNKWGQGVKGQIYTDYTIFDYDIEPQIIGLDFGFNHPTALVYLTFIDDAEKIKLYAQEKLYKTGLTGPLILEEFEKLKVPKNVLIVGDNARPELIQQIKQAGYKIISCEKGKGSVEDGISKVKEFDLYINGGNFEKEVAGYVRKIDKNGQSLEVPVDDRNHICDGLRYGVLEKYGKPQVGDYTVLLNI